MSTLPERPRLAAVRLGGLAPLRRPLRSLALAALVAVPLLAVRSSLRGSLHTLYFPSGWLVAAALAWFGLAWWWPVSGLTRITRKVDQQLGLGAVLLVLFAVHVDFRGPTGWLDGALTAGFVALMVSLAAGVALTWPCPAPRRLAREFQLRRWQRVHVGIAFGLLSLTAVHATLVHAHGLMAFLIKGEAS